MRVPLKRFWSKRNRSKPAVEAVGSYPLQQKGFLWGLGAAVIGGIAFNSALAGGAFFVLFLNASLVWRRDEVPILPFCLSYQWLYAVSGYLWQLATGDYPGYETIGNLQGAVMLSLFGLTCLALGVRLGIHLWDRFNAKTVARVSASQPTYNLLLLFVITFAVNATGLIWKASAMGVWYGGAQIIYRFLEFKLVLLVMLWLAVFKQGRGYGYAALAGISAFAASLGSIMSSFSGVFMLFVIVILTEWKPWLTGQLDQRKNRRMILIAVVTTVVVFQLGLIWQGAVKEAWRSQVREEGEQVSKGDAGDFVQIVREELPNVTFKESLESVSERMSSDLLYFSYVLDRVPELVPHENGALTMRALKHVMMPRFLFPNKASLGSDSWLVIRYAGVDAAGEAQGTSVGLGYIAQFYIDYAAPLMFVPLLIYGFIIGAVYRALQRFSPSYIMWMSAATIMCFGTFSSYGGEIAKLFGALILCLVIYSAILLTLGRWLHQWLVAATPVASTRITTREARRRRAAQSERLRTEAETVEPTGLDPGPDRT